MGCQYMAFQLESYFKTKGKLYDGSATLRLTGNDCRTLEENIQSFCQSFLNAPTVNNTRKARAKVSLFLELVQLWLPIAHEVRDVSTTTERVNNFQDNVDRFAAHLTSSFPSECSE